jgi:glycosyltransferase involved in cell wall biosynthesis
MMGTTNGKHSVLTVASFLAGHDGRWCYAEDLSVRLRQEGFTVRTASSFYFKPFRLADMVGAALGCRGGFEAALVDVYSGQAFTWAEAVARTLKVRRKPFILALHGGNLPTFASKHTARVQRVLLMADAVVAPSSYLLEAFSKWRSDIRLIPNAIDLALYPRAPRNQSGPMLMWLRSFHFMYDPAMAIRVLARVRSHFPGARLTMVGMDRGDGSQQYCQRLAQDLGLADKVHFRGVVPKQQVGAVLGEGTIFLNTTRVDNTPVSVLEAMACGLCVVSTNAGGVPYLVRDGVDALLVGTGDEDAMTQRVLELLGNEELARKLSEAAATRACEFGWDAILPRWTKLLLDLAEGRSRGVAC